MYTSLISTKELQEILEKENTIIIDNRFFLADIEKGRSDYLSSHIPNAFYAHMDNDLSGPIIPGKTGRHPLPSIKKIEQLFSSWGIQSDTQVIVYDQFHGGIAARLWWMLRWLGHDKVAVLEGGWKAWTNAKLTTTNQLTEAKKSIFKANPKMEWVVDANGVLENFDSQKHLLVDSRAAERYLGEQEPIDPVAGHIRGAVSHPFLENIDADGFFLPKKVLQTRFDNLLKKRAPAQCIFYCGSGVTACHNLLALKYAGYADAKIYPGSWSDWITDMDRPMKRK